MMNKESFVKWLENNASISAYSIGRYAGAIDTLSSELENYELSESDLYNISDSGVIDKILTNPDFIEKNARGNRMYSAALNHLKSYIDHINDNKLQQGQLKEAKEAEKHFVENHIKIQQENLSTNLLTSFSWTIVNSSVAEKALDKSSLEYNGTGIPVEIRPFFNVDNMQIGEKEELILHVKNKKYNAYIAMNKTSRTRMFWDSTFTSLLQETFPRFHYQLLNDVEVNSDNPKLRFEKTNVAENIYEVMLVHPVNVKVMENDIAAELIENGEQRKEGAVSTYYGKRYERDPMNRKRAIEIHGASCVACGFNFEQVYGERGKDFIEVHHTKPLHTFGGEQQAINPETDLVPVCSNCHRMIHRKHDEVLSIDELKEILGNIQRH